MLLYTPTSKLQLKYRTHPSEPSEIKLNGSLTTTELKKPHPSRLVGGVQTWNGLVPHPHVWWIIIQEAYLGSEVSQLLPKPRFPLPGR